MEKKCQLLQGELGSGLYWDLHRGQELGQEELALLVPWETELSHESGVPTHRI